MPASGGRATSVVEAIQTAVEHLYGTRVEMRVSDYLIDAATRASLPGAQTHLPEQLFVRGAHSVRSTEAGEARRGAPADADDVDVVEVALYLDHTLVDQLTHDDPSVRLHRGNLEAFCIVAEGISHFVFLAWRLGSGQDVTALELELQAEVDKFCLCALLSAAQQGAPHALDAPALWRQLFVDYELRPGLNQEEQHRYQIASRAAGRIARSMLSAARGQVQAEVVVRQARLWSRRSLADKMHGRS